MTVIQQLILARFSMIPIVLQMDRVSTESVIKLWVVFLVSKEREVVEKEVITSGA
jgi:hypothetical protein